MFMSACGGFPPHPHTHKRYTFTVHKAHSMHYIQHSRLLVELLHVYANIRTYIAYKTMYITTFYHIHIQYVTLYTHNLYILIQCADPMCTYVYIYIYVCTCVYICVRTTHVYKYACIYCMPFHASLWMLKGGGLVQVPSLVLPKGADVVSLQSPKPHSSIRRG